MFRESLLHHCYFVGLLLGPMNYDICSQLEIALSIIGKQKKKMATWIFKNSVKTVHEDTVQRKIVLQVRG